MLKKFAFYLPQFHEIKENNKWWGEGFTEWTNVKQAKALYKNHLQPKVPIDGYYNLLDKQTVINQTNLLHKYGIDGFIYYHYYFEGKLLLEKPAENLLKWKDINHKFFFCWANHSWNRSWNGSKEILIEQTYGDELTWEKHFNYLLKFFMDERYEKKDNKPLFMIFDSSFKEKTKMFEYFNKRCIENGFNGILIINTYKSYNQIQNNIDNYDYYNFLREPTNGMISYIHSIKNFNIRLLNKIKQIMNNHLNSNFIRKYDGNKILEWLNKNFIKEEKLLHGLFFEWDNTPRHKNRGYVITPIKKETMFNYLNHVKDEEYIFINAWNEWAEGMILEGTKENGYKYLTWIKEWTDKEN